MFTDICQELINYSYTRGDRKVRFLGFFFFLVQRIVRILSKFCDVHIEIKYISSNWMLYEKQV